MPDFKSSLKFVSLQFLYKDFQDDYILQHWLKQLSVYLMRFI